MLPGQWPPVGAPTQTVTRLETATAGNNTPVTPTGTETAASTPATAAVETAMEVDPPHGKTGMAEDPELANLTPTQLRAEISKLEQLVNDTEAPATSIYKRTLAQHLNKLKDALAEHKSGGKKLDAAQAKVTDLVEAKQQAEAKVTEAQKALAQAEQAVAQLTLQLTTAQEDLVKIKQDVGTTVSHPAAAQIPANVQDHMFLTLTQAGMKPEHLLLLRTALGANQGLPTEVPGTPGAAPVPPATQQQIAPGTAYQAQAVDNTASPTAPSAANGLSTPSILAPPNTQTTVADTQGVNDNGVPTQPPRERSRTPDGARSSASNAGSSAKPAAT